MSDASDVFVPRFTPSPDGLTAVVRLCGLTGQDALSDTP